MKNPTVKSVLGQEIPEYLVPYDRIRSEAMAALVAYNQLIIMEIGAYQTPDSQLGKLSIQLLQLVTPVYGNPTNYYVARLFVSLIGSFEVFLTDMCVQVLRRYPKKVGSATFTLTEILDSETVDALTTRAAEDAVNKMMYKSPMEYFKAVCEILSLVPSEIDSGWRTFVEAKARRDLGVHSAWKCNPVYLKKIGDVGLMPAYSIGDMVLPSEKDYFAGVVATIESLAMKIVDNLASKRMV